MLLVDDMRSATRERPQHFPTRAADGVKELDALRQRRSRLL
ncbi:MULTISPECIES: hypothetical protein [unclassified Rathayibacter]|nr:MULTISPECIES: hypothetical protein [unclassified Rathayibacter]